MNQQQIALIIAQVIAAVNSDKSIVKAQKRGAKRRDYGTVVKAKPYAPKNTAVELEPKADRQVKRLAAITKGFQKMGLAIVFDKNTGRFDNVKSYKMWVSEGRRVIKGQHGVMGLFHISQTQTDVAPAMPSLEGHVITRLPITAPELGAKVVARSLSELSQLIPA